MSAEVKKKNAGMPSSNPVTGRFQNVQRGTQDELEILAQIVAVSPNIRMTVFEQIRKARKRVQEREKRSTPVAE